MYIFIIIACDLTITEKQSREELNIGHFIYFGQLVYHHKEAVIQNTLKMSQYTKAPKASMFNTLPCILLSLIILNIYEIFKLYKQLLNLYLVKSKIKIQQKIALMK